MTGATHRWGGVLSVLAGYTILESKGLILSNVAPLVQLAVMYPFAIYGGVASDLDHHSESTPCKDLVSVTINKALHIGGSVKKVFGLTGKSPLLDFFNAKHRSWQTHSDLFLLMMILWLGFILKGGVITPTNIIITLMLSGFILGVISHLVLDMLSPEGIWFLSFCLIRKITRVPLPKKVSLVPKFSFFKTESAWENFIRWIIKLVSVLLTVYILYQMSPYEISFEKIGF